MKLERPPPSAAGNGAFAACFHSLGEQLLALEQGIAQAWRERRRQMERQQHELDQTSHNLQQVHRAYAQGRESAWQPYF